MRGARTWTWSGTNAASAGVTALLVVSIMITRADVAWIDLAGYLAYLALFLTLPGVLVWRLLWTGGQGTLLEHVVFGTLLAMILQFPVYLLGVAIGIPRLTLLLPVLTVIGCLARKDRRRLFLPRTDPVRPLVAWTLAVALSYAVLWETRIGWTAAPSWGRAPADPIGDQTFHLALVSELRHHAIPTMPFIDGQPLQYHWFVNEFLAATTWWTRAPSWVLLDRLLLPTCLALVLGAVAVLGQRLTGRAGGGALAVGILVFVGDLSPFRWSVVRSNLDERFLAYFDPVSPSLQFSVAMLLMFSLVIVHLLQKPSIVGRDVLLLGLTVVLLPLAKGSALPLAIGGLLCVIVVRLLGRERPRRREVALFVLACGVLALAQITVFDGAPGMAFKPFDIDGYVAWNLGLSGYNGGPPVPATAAVNAFAITGLALSWACAATGVLGFARAGAWRDPRAVFLVGSGVAGCAAAMAFGHPHLAQDYFARTSAAPLAIASAWGLLHLVRERSAGFVARVLGAGLAGGFVVAWLGARFAPATRPRLTAANQDHLMGVMIRPYLAIALMLVLVTIVLVVLVRRGRLGRAVALAATLAMVVGLGLLRIPGTFQGAADARARPLPGPMKVSIGRGGFEASAWLRGHSSVDDLIATNAHFLRPGGTDNRHFWIAALTERRVLLEGWGYTPELGNIVDTSTSSFYVPFWDQTLLKGNDAAFTDPSEATLDFLERRDVRWLFVDDRYPVDLSALRTVARQRFHSGRYWVFRVR